MEGKLVRNVFPGVAALVPLLMLGSPKWCQAQGNTSGPVPVTSEFPATAPAAVSIDKNLANSDAAAPRSIELAFCIDCSGSMSTVLPRALAAIRSIIAETRTANPDSTVRVGILRYGDQLRRYQVFELSEDAAVTERLIDGTRIANCGSEYVGAFVQMAAQRLHWNRDAVKKIYVVGNETAAQGPAQLDYRTTIQRAVADGFCVNALYCPPSSMEDQAVARQAAQKREAIARYSQQGPLPQVLPNGGPAQRQPLYPFALATRQTWLLAAYLGKGDCLKLNPDPSEPLFSRLNPEEVRHLVEVEIPQEEEAYAQAQAVERQTQQISYLLWLGQQQRQGRMPAGNTVRRR